MSFYKYQKTMKQSLIKIISLLLIIGLNWTGLSAIGQTLAGFSDIEISTGNVYSAGFLDFFLATSTDDFVNLTPEEENYLAKREVQIVQNGSLGFWYKVKASPIPQPTSQNCNKFTLTLFLENGFSITQNLSSFETNPIQFSDLTNDLVFKIGLAEEISGTKKCKFNLEFEAWQDSSMASGFFDKEAISNYVETKKEPSSQPQADIVINEFLPNPDSNAPPPANREFIELKNNGNSQIDVAGWKISEITSGGEERKYTITTTGGPNTAVPYGGSTVIPAGGWLVLLLSDNTALNNNGDTIRLYDENDNLIDYYTYTGATQKNKSYARYPDGSENWYDPIPTPGAPNVLESGQEEITGSAISQAEDLPEEPILVPENSNQPQVEAEEPTEEPVLEEPIIEESGFEELGQELLAEESILEGEGELETEEEDMVEEENVTDSGPEGLEEQDVFDEEKEGNSDEGEEVKADAKEDVEQSEETAEEAVEEVIEENSTKESCEINQEEEELDESEEVNINEEDMNKEGSVGDENVVEEENTAGDGGEIEENVEDEDIVDEIVEEDTEEIDAKVDSASEQEEIENAGGNDAEKDTTDDGETEVVTEKDNEGIEEGFISDQSVEDASLDKNLTEEVGETTDEDSSSNSLDAQLIEEQTGSLPNDDFSISDASDESDEGDGSDSGNSDSGIDGENEL